MKSVLISIQPKWCELIASGKKTVEVRKTRPKIETPFKVYVYCTANKQGAKDLLEIHSTEGKIQKANCKVIGEFVCNRFTYIEAGYDTNGSKHLYNTAFIEHRMCIHDNELHEYLYKSRENSGGWAWHISDLVIYDEPKELSEFWKADKCPYASKDGCTYKYHCFRSGKVKRCGETLTRPFQSWGYVDEID